MNSLSGSVQKEVGYREARYALNDILKKEPFVGGIALFGGTEFVKAIFRLLAEAEFANIRVPILILSAGLDRDIFVPFSSVPRTIIMSPPYEEVISFSDYWLSIFTSMAKFIRAAESNIWLYDVFQATSNCNPRYRKCEAFSASDASYKFTLQPVYVRYAIIATHTIVKALKQAYDKICSRVNDNCTQNFIADFDSRLVLDEMTDISIDFSSDFNESLEPLTTSGYRLTFGALSNPINTSDTDIYQMYLAKENNGKLEFRKVCDNLITAGSYLVMNTRMQINTRVVADKIIIARKTKYM